MRAAVSRLGVRGDAASEEMCPPEVVDLHEPPQGAGLVDDRQRGDLTLFHDMQGVRGEILLVDRDRIGGHDVGGGQLERLAVTLEYGRVLPIRDATLEKKSGDESPNQRRNHWRMLPFEFFTSERQPTHSRAGDEPREPTSDDRAFELRA